MSGSPNANLIWTLYNHPARVFTLPWIALLLGETRFEALNQKLNYYVRSGKLLRPRKGIYAKPDYTPEELTCVLYTPSYISLEYVLQKAGVIFQFDNRITAISYLSRTMSIAGQEIVYRKVKGEILANAEGITHEGSLNIATPERAFLDTLYLNPAYYFDNVLSLDKQAIISLLPMYGSKALAKRVDEIFAYHGH